MSVGKNILDYEGTPKVDSVNFGEKNRDKLVFEGKFSNNKICIRVPNWIKNISIIRGNYKCHTENCSLYVIIH